MKYIVALFCMIVSLSVSEVFARDWYVSAERGKGKKGTIEKPARDLSFILRRLEPGDVVHIAEGTYLSKNEAGVDEINVPVSIIGGYSNDFSKRDPWGEHRTVLTGINPGGGWAQGPRLYIKLGKYRGEEHPKITIDGLIIDQGPMNRYKTDKRQQIVRKGGGGMKPTPDLSAVIIGLGKPSKVGATPSEIEFKNNIIINSASSQGSVKLYSFKGGKVTVTNNVILNQTGPGLALGSNTAAYRPDSPTFEVTNNTIAFSWLYDELTTTRPASAVWIEEYVKVSMRDNVFTMADTDTIEFKGRSDNEEFFLDLRNNIISMGKKSDYRETNMGTAARIEDLEDEAELLSYDSEGNESLNIVLPVSQEWAELYAARVLVDRAAVEQNIKPAAGWQNDLRGMLGLNLQAGNIGEVGGAIWLPQLPLDDAIAVAVGGPYEGRGAGTPGF